MSHAGLDKDRKAKYLQQEGMLYASAEKVSDPKFREGEFFDPRDIVQVKYEMLRRVRIEGASVSQATGEYGFTRPTYYQAKERFDAAGIAGLVPGKRGPRSRHKLQSEVLTFLRGQITPGRPIGARRLALLVQEKHGIKIHPRTIERALGLKKTT